jgi:endoglucanase
MSSPDPGPGGALAAAASQHLARTLNLGLISGPGSRQWGHDVGEEHFRRCAEAGFTAVRLAVDFTGLAQETPPYRISPALAGRVWRAIDAAGQHGLALVVTNFIYPGLMADPAAHRDRLLGIAGQLAQLVAEAPDSVLLEPLAEPHGRLDAVWNGYLAGLTSAVRRYLPHRPLIVGPGFYNTVRGLPSLELPSDPELIVTIHHYHPIEFTFQGEEWSSPEAASWLGTAWTGTDTERGELEAGFAMVARWAAERGRPVFLGEFGTTSHADAASRARWTRFSRELAERHGFSWGVWSYGPMYALWDDERQRWRPELLAALFDR